MSMPNSTSHPGCDAGTPQQGRIAVTVRDCHTPIERALVLVYRDEMEGRDQNKRKAPTWSTLRNCHYVRSETTDARGCATCVLDAGAYIVAYANQPDMDPRPVEVVAGCVAQVDFDLELNLEITRKFFSDGQLRDANYIPRTGDMVEIAAASNKKVASIFLEGPPGARRIDDRTVGIRAQSGIVATNLMVLLPPRADIGQLGGPDVPADAILRASITTNVDERTPQPIEGNIGVALQRTATAETDDLAHWRGIINSTERMSFNQYLRFMDMLFCADPALPDRDNFKTHFDILRKKRFLPFNDTDAYRLLKVATEAFVMVNCGVLIEDQFHNDRDRNAFALRDLPFPSDGLGALWERHLEPVAVGAGVADIRTLPYLAEIRRKLADVDIKLRPIDELDDELVSVCHGILQEKLAAPCLMELIWSYWHEEGMLVQTINAITRRFQNVRSGAKTDPLANLEIDPLRPLNNLLWGYVQDEQHRLSVVRRNYEYDHHYGLRLDGRAVQDHKAADTRSKFLEAFHHLLHMANVFFKQDDDTTVKADAFPALNALKEVHLILTEGQHNQFGDLPSTARVEMLMQQFLLARPEFREFLPTRISVAYPEAWMDRVDAMKKVQGWTDTSVLHFRNLGVFGEQILLGIRWGFWSDVQEPTRAFNWLRHFRPQIQGYIHAYRAATGVDLTSEAQDAKIDTTLPSALLRKRLASQQRSA